MNESDKRRIEQADAARRAAREAAELEAFAQNIERKPAYAGSHFAHVNAELVKGIGVVSPPLRPRARERWYGTLGTQAHKSGRTVGTASGLAQDVRVTHADGTTELRNVSAFRAPRDGTRSRQRKTQAQVVNAHITAANLAPIGDSNH